MYRGGCHAEQSHKSCCFLSQHHFLPKGKTQIGGNQHAYSKSVCCDGRNTVSMYTPTPVNNPIAAPFAVLPTYPQAPILLMLTALLIFMASRGEAPRGRSRNEGRWSRDTDTPPRKSRGRARAARPPQPNHFLSVRIENAQIWEKVSD